MKASTLKTAYVVIAILALFSAVFVQVKTGCFSVEAWEFLGPMLPLFCGYDFMLPIILAGASFGIFGLYKDALQRELEEEEESSAR